ncbi:MAG TPA: class I SAM-dependent methyltransferase [Longimicrobiales bacterium]|nr:class I SAM-dependent methyltransferase [Longimicrobiales bacterium]
MPGHRTPLLSGASRWPDHFSGAAARYERYRPRYPEALFDLLADVAPRRSVVWDCATGNGQAALALARRFEQVRATDASEAQLGRAPRRPRISYVSATAEATPFGARSFDLITVAQAAHWFDLEAFYREARRVAAEGAVIALWTYGLCEVSPAVDDAVGSFYRDVVGPYWPPQRRWVDQGYRNLPFPFDELRMQPPEMSHVWSAEDLLGYASTWSAVKRFRKATGEDPVETALRPALARSWPAGESREVRWPLGLRAGRVR